MSYQKPDISERWRIIAIQNLNRLGGNQRNHITEQKFDAYARLSARSLEGLRKYDPAEAASLSKSYELAMKNRRRYQEEASSNWLFLS